MKKFLIAIAIFLCAITYIKNSNAGSQSIFYKDGFIYVADDVIKQGGLNPAEPIYVACGEKSGEGPVGNEWLQTHNYKNLWENYRLIQTGNYWKSKLDSAFLKYGHIRFNLVQIKGDFGNIWFNVHNFKDEPWYNQSKGDILLSFEK